MSSATEVFRLLLKQQGHSVTRARLAVFEALIGQEPLSMHALVQHVQGIDRASVYRAVDLFERLGIIQRLNTGWKYKLELTDKFAAHHHHLTCLQCGKIVAMNEQTLEQMIERLALEHDFTPSSHQIEVQGVCRACRAAQLSERPSPKQ